MQVQKWGNSLAIRLPKALCQAVNIKEGKEVDLSIKEDAIIIKPKPKEETLAEMLEGITPDMYHKETFDDGAVGKEEW
ncbi:AbrB/MazE/SpoVT family DNA-binding domain-containing protein [Siminovitchia sp. 179-K 8D1 HS]|uniref:AbrB/MazE/SpoVT family DNA-binding domain-containing protein n=1 Tax=Siminovitchia sp. 179-K 8D1 HS TaxID=3142385 RepID=UPI0039A15171